jgi:hypothetical protein
MAREWLMPMRLDIRNVMQITDGSRSIWFLRLTGRCRPDNVIGRRII